MSNLRKAAEQALEALENSIDTVRHEYTEDWRHGLPTRKAQLDGMKESVDNHEQAITALRAALAEQVPLDSDIAKIVNDNLWTLYVEEPAEPVAWRTFDGEGSYDYRSYEDNEDYIYQYIKRNGGKYASWVEPLYTAPPQCKPLTEEEICSNDEVMECKAHIGAGMKELMRLVRAIERTHGIR